MLGCANDRNPDRAIFMDESESIYTRFLKSARTPSPEPEQKSDPAPQAEPPSQPRKTVGPKGHKRLILSATSKGGVGKSYLCVNLAEWLASQRVSFIGFDPDWCNSSFTRFYPGAQFLEVSQGVDLSPVIAALQSTDLVLMDGVGSMQMKFLEWLDESNVFEMRSELDLDITLIVIVEEDKETVFQAGQAAQRIGDRANWLVVRNLKTSPVTEIYDGSRARKDLLALGAREITLDRLPWNLSSVLQKQSKSIGSLVADEGVFFLERQRLRSYQQRIYEEFESAREVLLPGSLLGVPTRAPEPIQIRTGHAQPRIPPAEV